MKEKKFIISEKLLGQDARELKLKKVLELGDVVQYELKEQEGIFLDHLVPKTVISTNTDYLVNNVTLILKMAFSSELHTQMTTEYGKPDGMFNVGKPSKTTYSEPDSWKSKIIEHKMEQVTIKEHPENIIWNKGDFQIMIRSFLKHNMSSVSFYKHSVDN